MRFADHFGNDGIWQQIENAGCHVAIEGGIRVRQRFGSIGCAHYCASGPACQSPTCNPGARRWLLQLRWCMDVRQKITPLIHHQVISLPHPMDTRHME